VFSKESKNDIINKKIMKKRFSKTAPLNSRVIRVLFSLFLAIFFIATANTNSALASDHQMPGTIEGTGMNFEITDSDYLNITLDSTESIKAMVRSIPEMIMINIESDPDIIPAPTTTQIIIGGLLANTTYYQYEDDLHNLTEFTTDATWYLSKRNPVPNLLKTMP